MNADGRSRLVARDASGRDAGARPRIPPLVGWLFATLACSSPTDIVAVVDARGDEVPATASTNDAPDADAARANAGDRGAGVDDGEGAADVALLLAGRPMDDWAGVVLEWPLSTPLAELFAEPASAARDDGDARPPLEPRFSRRLSARGADAVPPRSSAFEARLLILDEDEARELLGLLASTAGPGTGRGVVFRDEHGDVYQVALESDERSLAGAGCFGRMRRDPFDCEGRGPFD